MLVSYDKRFIFIHVYKTGGSSIITALRNYYNLRQRSFIGSVSNRLNRLICAPPVSELCQYEPHLIARDAKKLLPGHVYDDFWKFAFVRNPWDWQVSIYFYMLKTEHHVQHELIKSMRNFDEYIEWRVSEDRHLQKEFVTNEEGEVIVDFIGRY